MLVPESKTKSKCPNGMIFLAGALASVRFVSSFGSFAAVEGAFSALLNDVFRMESWGSGAAKASMALGLSIAVLNATGDGLAKGMSEVNKLFAQKDLTGIPCGVIFRSWFLALSNAVTTAASAFNGAGNIFYFADDVGKEALGVIFAVSVFSSSSIFNVKKQLENYKKEREVTVLPFKTRQYAAMYGLTLGMSCITNGAFTAFQVLSMLDSFGLGKTSPVSLGVTSLIVILSDMNLFYAAMPDTRQDFIKLESRKMRAGQHSAAATELFPLLPSPEEAQEPVNQSRAANIIKSICHALIKASFVFGVFNTPDGLKDLITTCVGMIDDFMGRHEAQAGPAWESSIAMVYTILLVGLAIAIPGAVVNAALRIKPAVDQMDRVIDGCWAWRCKEPAATPGPVAETGRPRSNSRSPSPDLDAKSAGPGSG